MRNVKTRLPTRSKHDPAIVRHEVFGLDVNDRVRERTADRVGPAVEAAPLGEDDHFDEGRVVGQFDERLDVLHRPRLPLL